MANGRRRAALAAGVRWLLKVSLVVLAVGFLWRNSFGAPSALRRRRAGGAVRLHAAASSGSGGGAAGETAVYADDGGGDLAYDDPAAEAATPSLAAVAPARQQPAKPAAAAASASASAAESPTSSRTPAATSPAVAASPSPSGTRSREPPPPPSPASTPSPSPSGVPPATKTPRPTGTPSPSGVSATATAAVSASAPPRARSGAAFLPTVPPGWRPQPAVDVTPTSPQRHAYITMAAGNEAGRMAVALFQSIVSSGTSVADVDLVVLLPTSGIGSPECHDHRWKAARNRSHVRCDGSSPEPLIPEEVISPVYVDALRRLGAKLAVHAPLPQTPYTNGIPGGTQSSAYGRQRERAEGGHGGRCCARTSRGTMEQRGVQQSAARVKRWLHSSPHLVSRARRLGHVAQPARCVQHDAVQEAGVDGQRRSSAQGARQQQL